MSIVTVRAFAPSPILDAIDHWWNLSARDYWELFIGDAKLECPDGEEDAALQQCIASARSAFPGAVLVY